MAKNVKPKKSAKKENAQITGTMSIGEVVAKWPGAAVVFANHGMHCIGCAIASFENIESGARAHGMDADKLIKDLNDYVKKQKRR